jgi:hypothetical protein
MYLEEMIGQTLVGEVSCFDGFGDEPHVQFKLLSVDSGGLWVESQSIHEFFLKKAGATSSPRSAIFFLPYSSIRYLSFAQDVPALSEKVLE